MALHAWTSAQYVVPLPPGHRFPMEKYELLRQRVLAEGLVPASHLLEPPRATTEQLRRVHTADYVERLMSGALSDAELRRLGFPWSAGLVERSLRAVGGTCAAVHHALDHGVAMNLAGGTHHAFATHGEGFCVFNDVGVALHDALALGRIRRAAVIDLDVHQGNGTAKIFRHSRHVFTFSMHEEKNYPIKEKGSLDIGLDSAMHDEEYLNLVETNLMKVRKSYKADLVFFVAGVDPYENDRLGGLSISKEGMAARDRMVCEMFADTPIAAVLAGGYAIKTEDTVDLHIQTAKALAGMI